MGKKYVTFASASGNSRSGYRLVKNSAFINVDLPRPDSPKIKIHHRPNEIFPQIIPTEKSVENITGWIKCADKSKAPRSQRILFLLTNSSIYGFVRRPW